MRIKYTFLTAIITLIILSGCSTTPSLLHQRGTQVWIMDKGGNNAKLVTNGSLPQWIWGGRSHIAFFRSAKPCDPKGPSICGKIYVVKWDSKKQSIAGKPKAITAADSGPNFTWSRDGQWLVIESFRDKNWEIYKIKRDGSAAINLTKNPYKDVQPDWTHNGKKNGKIVFVSNRTGDKDIFVIDNNGGSLVNLTKDIPGLNNKPDGGDDWGPVWASNADTIAFVGTHEAWGYLSPMIYSITASKAGIPTVISDVNKGRYSRPAWEGSESLFFMNSNGGVIRYDSKTGKRSLLANLPTFAGQQYAVDPQFIYIGTSQGIKAVEWNLKNKVKNVGPGFNPDT